MPPLVGGFRPVLRSLARSRTFTVTAILTLALGMGATAAMYTLVQHVVLDPLPYPQPDRLVRLKNPFPAVGKDVEWELSTAQYFYYGQHATDLAKIGLFQQDGANLSAGGTAQRVTVATVTATLFDLLGGRAAAGRMIDANDDAPGAPAVAMLSYEFWNRQFGRDPAVVGRTLQLNDRPVLVVGVLNAGLRLPAEPGQAMSVATDVWMPFQLNPAGPFYNSHVFPAVARLAPGYTAAQAQAQLRTLVPGLVAQFPNVYNARFFEPQRGMRTAVYPLRAYVLGDMARDLWIVFAGVAIVLIIACANAMNLFLVRLEGRRREFAIRAALGAEGRHVAAEAFREGLLVAVAAAAGSVGIAYAATRWLGRLQPAGLPRLDALTVDWRTYLFSALLAVAIAGVMASVPVFQTRSWHALQTLGDGGRTATAGRSRQRLRRGLVVAQVALALVLAVSAGLLLQSFASLRRVDPGVKPDGVLTLQVYLPWQRYDSAYKVWQFISRTQASIAGIPGVTAAGAGSELPFVSDYGCTVQGFEDHAVQERLTQIKESTCAGQGIASPGYLEALGIPVLAGRAFTAADNEDPSLGSVVVSRTFAERFFGTTDVIGKGVGPNGRGKPPFYRIVGVIGDTHAQSLETAPANAVYYPVMPMSGNWGDRGFFLAIRTARGDPMSYLPAVRAAVAKVDPDIPVADAVALQTLINRSMSRLTFTMALLAMAGFTALLLAAVGLYGVISYIVARRTNEIGVRLALGARPGQVQRLVVRESLGLTATGLAVGVLAALASARVLGGLLYGVATWAPESYVAAAVVLTLVALAAGWIPARRAAAVDPAIALRAE